MHHSRPKAAQLRKLAQKLNHLAVSKRFKLLPAHQQRFLLKRFKKLNRQLRPEISQLNLRPACLALLASAGLLAPQQQVQAQVPAFGTPLTNPFNLVAVNNEAKPSYADIDNDGDFDLFAGDGDGDINFFLNIGTANAPLFDSLQVNPFGLAPPTAANYVSVHLQDMDNDGDYDLWYGDDSFQLIYFENNGTVTAPSFAIPVVNPFGLTSPPNQDEAKITTGDLDGDGDFDMLVGAAYTDLFYYQNTGTNMAPAFAAPVTNPFGLAAVGGYYAAPTIADIDRDGDFDVGVSNYYGIFYFFENTGTTTAPAFAAQVANPFGITTVSGYSAAVFADLDGDGDDDITLGEAYGNFVYQPDTSGGGANAAPVLAIAANDTVCDTDTLDIPFTASDPNGDPLVVTAVSSNQAVIADADISVVGTAPNYDLVAVPSMPGNTDIIITVSDSVASVSDTIAINVESCAPNTVPVVTVPANDTVCEDSTLSLAFMAMDGDGDSLFVDAFSSNQAVVNDLDISISGTAPNYNLDLTASGVGTTTIYIEVDDGEDVAVDSFLVEVDDCSVGLDANFFARRFEVYPNPVRERLHYDLELYVAVERMQVELIDVTGRVLADEVHAQPSAELKGSMDVHQLPQGIYFLRVSSELYSFTKKVAVK